MKSFASKAAVITACAALLASTALAQQIVYPAKGQSPDMQKKDEYECHQWAVQQTGYDPTKAAAPAAAPKPATTATGTTPGAGATRRRARCGRR